MGGWMVQGSNASSSNEGKRVREGVRPAESFTETHTRETKKQ